MTFIVRFSLLQDPVYQRLNLSLIVYRGRGFFPEEEVHKTFCRYQVFQWGGQDNASILYCFILHLNKSPLLSDRVR